MKTTRSELQEMADLAREGKLEPVVDKVFQFEDALEAYARQKSGRWASNSFFLLLGLARTTRVTKVAADFLLIAAVFAQVKGQGCRLARVGGYSTPLHACLLAFPTLICTHGILNRTDSNHNL